MTIIAVVSVFYELFRTNAVVNAVLSGMQAGVAAVICDVVVSMFLGEAKGKKILPIVIMLLSFSLTYFLKVNVVYIILACILWSVAVFFVRARPRKEAEGGNQKMIYWQLFLVFVQVGLFSVGGGYAAIPLIQDYVVEGHGWLTMTDFTDLITIAEMTPGPIAINSATFVGMRVGGLGGAVLATLGCILPSGIIVCLLAFLYFRYRKLTLVQGMLGTLRPAVVGLTPPPRSPLLCLLYGARAGFLRASSISI